MAVIYGDKQRLYAIEDKQESMPCALVVRCNNFGVSVIVSVEIQSDPTLGPRDIDFRPLLQCKSESGWIP